MEYFKKFGKSYFAKHLRTTKGKWTKRMANSKSRLKSKLDTKTQNDWDQVKRTPNPVLIDVVNEFDGREWTWDD